MNAPETLAREPQSAGAVLMVRPANFAFNPQTAASNAFQFADAVPATPEARLAGAGSRPESGSAGDLQVMARHEFERLAEGLSRAGIAVIVAEDTASPVKPDAVYPNNWVSFHVDGSVVLYPMLAPNRRLERRDDVLRQVTEQGGYLIRRTVDLTHHESRSQFLEGTGSLVLDRANRIAYASLSPRTALDVLGEFAQRLDYHLATFEAVDGAAKPVYHTNVVMAVGTRFAVVCGAAVEPVRRAALFDTLRAGGHEIVDISLAQMHRFGANLLELAAATGPVIALSANAWESFDSRQRSLLERHGSVLAVNIPVIERVGGGGVRCMLAEIHLPRRAAAPAA